MGDFQYINQYDNRMKNKVIRLVLTLITSYYGLKTKIRFWNFLKSIIFHSFIFSFLAVASPFRRFAPSPFRSVAPSFSRPFALLVPSSSHSVVQSFSRTVVQSCCRSVVPSPRSYCSIAIMKFSSALTLY